MSNKKRQSKRKPKLPSKFNDHVMNSMSQNRKDLNGIDDMDEIRVTIDDKIEEIGENCNVRNRTVIEGDVEDVCDSDSDNDIVLESDELKECNVVFGSIDTIEEDQSGNYGLDHVEFVANVETMMDEVLVENVVMNSSNETGSGTTEGDASNNGDTARRNDADKQINSNKLSKNDVEKETDADKQSNSNKLENVSSLNFSSSKVDAVNDCTIGNTMFGNSFVKSYAKTVEKRELNKNLYCIPTSKKDNGDEVVVFDEEIVEEGSKKWLNTVYGYFVGCNMSPVELRYNIRRMWSKYGLYDIISNGNSVWLFNFRNKEGMNTIVNQSSWMVNGKPLMVQKWNLDSVKGLSALASRLGKPLVMDDITASMCHNGTGRSAFARILVEMDASKGFKDTIEIQYKDKSNTVIRTKFVKVEFSWKLVSCSQCKVFGHNDSKCYKNGIKKNQMGANKEAKLNQDTEGTRKDEGNAKVQYKYIPKNDGNKKQMGSANKYYILANNEENENEYEEFRDRRLEVDNFIIEKKQPSNEDTADWTYDMKEYFKLKWKEMCRMENECESESDDDLIYEENEATNNVIADEIEGVDAGQKEVKEFIFKENLSICVVLETHLKESKAGKIGNLVFGNWQWCSNAQYSTNSCRILVGWNPNEVSLMIVHSSKQSILCIVESLQKNVKFFCSFIYAMGDFNVTLKTSEHSASGSFMSNDMLDFNECANNIEVEDICSSGFYFTWTKSLKNPNSSIMKKLDRIMINEEFIQQFQSAYGIFLPYVISNHSPAVITILEGLQKKRRSFKFINYIADKDDFADCVRKEWDTEIHGCHMYRVLSEAQAKVEKNPFDKDLKINAVSLLNDYMEATNDELKLLHQKAKVKWLSEGDQNTTYFHGILKFRKHKGRIESICDEIGMRFEGDNVVNVFVEHFKKFIGSKHEVQPLESTEVDFDIVLNKEEANAMIGQVTDEEIKEAIFDIDCNKASGPNGYTSGFFKKAWNIVRKEVCLAIKDFFLNGKLLGEINATIIALVPKVEVPNKVSEFRPIACCNVIYKSISKILTNRIKTDLQKVVNINQSAFIPGRHIQDNILIAQELLKGYQRKKGAKRCALKIDIQKAYDTVSWDFLENIMIKFGFHPVMVNWIMTCVKTTKFSICVNGEAHGYFNGGRGLRQGDPISPYLFTLVMEVFSLILSKNIEKAKKFKFHYGCKDLQLSNMCFADDLLVYSTADN
ncbi:RNA-directed DNA polymerase, eukaryota, reverse transcriptase zinc-binding domain protein [Tanacetum coccineum]